MSGRAWVEAAVDEFNDAIDSGERLEETLTTLTERLAAAPGDASAQQREMVRVLRDIVGARLESDWRDVADPPYDAGRLAGDRLELHRAAEDLWVPYDQRGESPPATASASAPLRDLWQTFHKTGPEIERRFAEHVGDGRQLINVVEGLMEAGDSELVEDIAQTALAQGARYPGLWWPIVGEARLGRSDLGGARDAIARGLLYTSTYRPAALALMFRWYEATGAAPETLAVVYAGAASYAFDLKQKKHLGWRSLPRPTQLKTRFGVLFAEWIREAWPGVEAFTHEQLLHLRRLFESLAARPLKDLRGEIDARLATLARV